MPIDHLGVRAFSFVGIFIIIEMIQMWRQALTDDDERPGPAQWILFISVLSLVGMAVVSGMLYKERLMAATMLAAPLVPLPAISWYLFRHGLHRSAQAAREIPLALYLFGVLPAGGIALVGLMFTGAVGSEMPLLVVAGAMAFTGFACGYYGARTRHVREYLARSSWSSMTMDDIEPGWSYREAERQNEAAPVYPPPRSVSRRQPDSEPPSLL